MRQNIFKYLILKSKSKDPLKVFGILIFLLWSNVSFGEDIATFLGNTPFPWRKVKTGAILSKSKVDSLKGTKQSLSINTIGLHKNSCRISVKKIQRYEDMHEYIPFVKKSTFNDNTNNLMLTFESTLLPWPFLLDFTFPRLTGIGHYPFYFDKGFLKGLQGQVILKEVNGRCLYYLRANWAGPDSGIPNVIFEMFTATLLRIGLEKLFRVSTF